MYILISYKLVNGFKRQFNILYEDNEKSRLEYLMNCSRCIELKKQGHIFEIYKKEV